MTPLIVLPAAGSSSRMRGRDKLLETVDGMPLLRRQALAALETGLPVAVTLPKGAGARRDALADLPLDVCDIADADEGLSASLRAAQAMLATNQSLGILLPDVPGIGVADIQAVLDRFLDLREARVTRGGRMGDDRPGTPLFLPHAIAIRFAGLTGDDGGRSVLRDEEVELVRFPDDRAVRDLDTPEAWAEWRRDSGTAR
ncbi:MAG: NTP transferase domain-containing protein [Silicimonas sp.]|nr:NTP transferase domain-containing protein [Silicimonas sp.]